ncbi:hypothetical protein BC832DRAFT_590758 [Gaertneriomyces semiglobifer]|nr:hypothetical protein BC832DRAFT_590758 [Gaertneriomyces semiglobifer]
MPAVVPVLMKEQALFGGAITTVIPDGFVDASQFREVPDNQEVFVSMRNPDQSMIVELLELAEDASDAAAARFHFQQLAEDNQALECAVRDIQVLDPRQAIPHLAAANGHVSVLVGNQTVTKFRSTNPENPEAIPHVIQINMTVIRIPHVSTDLVISVNTPLSADAPASAAASEILSQSLQALSVRDWGLFGV